MNVNRISIPVLGALAAVVLPLSLRAATETVDGIEWTYTVSNGEASVYNSNIIEAAIPTSTSGAIAIPATLGGCPVTSIGDYGFYNCANITSVTIHVSVTSIGRYAFDGCYGLMSMTIPDSVTSIGDSAFSGTYIESVTIGNFVTSIGEDAFPSSLRSFVVGAENPSYCSVNSLLLSKDGKTLIRGVCGDVEIPDSVTSIGDSAFFMCFSLTSVTIPDSVTNIGNSAFAYCGLRSVTIPDSVTSIGDSAFEQCSVLMSVTISDSVTSIGDSAFSCGGTLESIAVGAGNPNYCSVNGLLLSKDGKSLIQGVNGNVVIPDTVMSIGDGAFSNCSGLRSVTIPNSVTNIGNSAFSDCGITSVSIPDSVTSIGNSAFSDCFDIQVLYLPSHFQGSTSNLSIPEDCAVGFFSVPPEAIYTVDFSANGGTGNMNPQIIACDVDTALISNAFTQVGYAFAGWATTEDGAVAYANGATVRNLAAADASVTLYAKWTPNVYDVTLDPQGGSGGTASVTATYGSAMPAITVPTLANYRFKGYVTRPNGGTQYYTAAGTSARNWDIPNNTTLYASWLRNQSPAFESVLPDGDFIAMEIGATEDFSVTTSDPDEDAVTVKWYLVEEADQNRRLAGSGNDFTFTATTAGCFRVEAEASDGTDTTSAFWDVKVFTADVADYDEVPGSGLVWSVSGTTLTISGNGPMPDYADAEPPYQGYAGTVTAIVVEEGVTRVGDNAFQDFQGVASVSLPQTLASIGIGAFADCGSLVTIAIPDSVETLGEGMFSGCDNLAMLYLPQWFMDSLDYLGVPDACSVANTDVYSFVRRLYNLCLGREPEWTGCASWSKRLTSGERNGAMAAYGFFMSGEMKRRNLSNAEYVEILYRALMDRAPDSNGKAYWVDLLDNGVSRAGVFRGFAESAEFTRICGWYGITRGNVDRSKLEQRDLNYGVTKFVARCYTKALNRNYDVKGLNSWCGKINSSSTKKATAIQVARSFLKSAEFQRRNLSNAAYVEVLYQTFLGHAPDSKGRQSWLNKLNSGVSRDTVMAGFYNSNEFTNIMASYGIR